MPILHAIILGAVQGLTEFLPISSSGHLAIVPWLFGWDDYADPELQKAFDVAVHVGTLVAVVGYFRRDMVPLIVGGWNALFRRRLPVTAEGRLAWLLVLSAIPASIAGVVGNSLIDRLDDEIGLIAVMLIVFGVVLYVVDKYLPDRRSADSFSLRDALVIGFGQALALQPGVSRSSITITAGRGLGFARQDAARIAFLMSIPLIAGAALYSLVDIGGLSGVPTDLRVPFVVGMVTSAATGWLAVWGLLRLVRAATFAPFAIYRIIVGVGALLFLASSFR
jgi:undecaprenyl-diphosphatase